MAEFQASAGDFAEPIRRQRAALLRDGAPYVGAPWLAAVVVSVVHVPTALVLAGMGLAWAISAVREWRAVSEVTLWRHAWEQEASSVVLRPDGFRVANGRGTSEFRWSEGVEVRDWETCFVIEEGGEILVVLPKRFLDGNELLLLRARAAKPTYADAGR